MTDAFRRFSSLPFAVRGSIPVAAACLLVGLAKAMQWPAPLGTGETELKIVGSSSLRDPVEAWAAIFHRIHPEVHVRSAMYGTGLAASEIAARRADLAPMGREMLTGEMSLLGSGASPLAIKVGEWDNRSARSGPVYLYVARSADGVPDQNALEFVAVALSHDGQEQFGSAGIRGLTREARDAARARLGRLLEDSINSSLPNEGT